MSRERPVCLNCFVDGYEDEWERMLRTGRVESLNLSNHDRRWSATAA